MTILTKPLNEKNSEKSVFPLVTDGHTPSAPLASVNGDHDSESIIFHRRRMSSATTIFLFLSAIAVMCMGILGGVAIYRLYAPTQDRLHFRRYFEIPYDSQALFDNQPDRRDQAMRYNDNMDQISFWDAMRNATRGTLNPFRKLFNDDLDSNHFVEEFEVSVSDEESYAKITVPDFKDGRSGRFIHDFKENQSAIIDSDANRCFIMPLDRETVLPPKSLVDLLNKMYAGYYDIDTKRVRKNMRVVTPALTDMTIFSPKIAKECIGMNIYFLEKYTSGVFKRSAHISNDGKFAEFSGKHIVEFNLVNINDINDLEKKIDGNA